MIYERIKSLCKEKGITITGMEKELGFAKGSLSKIDKSNPSQERVMKIAKYLGVTPDYIMTGKNAEGESFYIDDEARGLAQFLFNKLRLSFFTRTITAFDNYKFTLSHITTSL